MFKDSHQSWYIPISPLSNIVVRVSGMSMGTTFITQTGRSMSAAANLRGKKCMVSVQRKLGRY